MTAVFAVVIYGALVAVTSTDQEFLALVIGVICGYFGWSALTRIQPSMFIWMSFVGWIVYFLIKGILSIFIGVFIAPFVLGKKISDAVARSLTGE